MTSVDHEMTKEVFCTLEGDKLSGVWEKMKNLRIRHVPVVRGKKLVGIFSDRDILKISDFVDGNISIPKITVSKVMSNDIVTCGPTTRLGDAVDIMLKNKIDCLPIVDEGQNLMGIITTTDVMRDYRRREGVTDRTAQEFSFDMTVM